MSPVQNNAGWKFDNSYAQLPPLFFAAQNPVSVREPRMIFFNHTLAQSLGLNAELLAGDEGTEIFAGNRIPQGARPIAQAYAGHQFGHFTMLGDGRAVLLGEHLTPLNTRFDIALKGSGQTPFSRRGDGRAVLGPMLREYIISEAMQALGIPTTRSLAVVATGEPVFRETALPGAVLTRVAKSHLRVGTFEYAAAIQNVEALKALADYTIARHYPTLVKHPRPYAAFVEAVSDAQAALVARWLLVGFVHGVMNTDNMSICGETIDYGPCAFIDSYNPEQVFSSIDHHGRYAYGNQPHIAQWNIARLAEALLPLLSEEEAEAVINHFPKRFAQHWLSGMRKKMGLFSEQAEDVDLIEYFLTLMQNEAGDFTNRFRQLCSSTETSALPALYDEWLAQWHKRRAKETQTPSEAAALMRAHNPAIIPRNHLVEEALADASERNDFSTAERLLATLAQPYDEQPLQTPPADSAQAYQTFCGT